MHWGDNDAEMEPERWGRAFQDGREEHMPESRCIFRFNKMFSEIKKKPNKTPKDVYWKVMGDEAGE